LEALVCFEAVVVHEGKRGKDSEGNLLVLLQFV
jgi:hypothetical protein